MVRSTIRGGTRGAGKRLRAFPLRWVQSLLAAAAAAAVLAAAASAAPSAFPVSVAADNGRVTIPAKPTRIVSLSPTATEILFAVGAGKQVLAVDDQSNFPVAAPRTKLSGFKPNIEAIARYRPDLVIVSSDIDTVVAKLEKLKIPVVQHDAVVDLSGVYRQITQTGAVTGHRAQAAKVVARMRARLATLTRQVGSRGQGRKVFHELGPDLFSVTSKTFVGTIYRRFGLTNIADGSPTDYPQLSAEAVIAANPDLIVLSDTKCCQQTAALVAARPGWSGIAAVKSGAVAGVNDDIASRWGPRIVRFAEVVAARLIALPAPG